MVTTLILMTGWARREWWQWKTYGGEAWCGGGAVMKVRDETWIGCDGGRWAGRWLWSFLGGLGLLRGGVVVQGYIMWTSVETGERDGGSSMSQWGIKFFVWVFLFVTPTW